MSRNISIATALSALFAILLTLGPSSSSAQDYLIGSQDVLKIAVFEYPDFTTEVRVSEDGRITFPLLGEITAKNLTARQVEKNIAEKLTQNNIVKNPQVSVFIQQYRGRKVTIIGEVIKPGQYEISGPTTILDLISLSLGLSQNAGYQLSLFRKELSGDGKEITKKIPIDVDRLLNNSDLASNVELQNSDIVYVPKSVFYIYGEVNRPSVYKLEKGLTVKRAITVAGGLTQIGSQDRVEVTRKDGDKELVVNAPADDLIQLDDVLRIKESIFYIYGEVNRPGSYRLDKDISMKKAIALAGGLTPKGTQSRIEVTRKDGDKDTILSANIDDRVQLYDVIMVKESIF